MYASDGGEAADSDNVAVRYDAGAPQECCGGLNNVDYSKVKMNFKVMWNKERVNALFALI